MANSFPQFSSLPSEIQAQIWEAAIFMDKPLILEAYLDQKYHEDHDDCIDYMFSFDTARLTARGERIDRPPPCAITRRLLVFPWAVPSQIQRPAILDVCRESRRIALKCGALSDVWLDISHQKPRSAYFRFGIDDIVLWTELRQGYPEFHIDLESPPPPLENPHHLARIRHLAVEWSFFHARQDSNSPEYKRFWTGAIRELYTYCPNLTDLYLCVPAVRYAQTSDMSQGGLHFSEPRDCKECPLRFAPMVPEQTLPGCSCFPSRPPTWAESKDEINRVFRSRWLRSVVQTEFWDAGIKITFPPRIHGRILLREGLDVEEVKKIVEMQHEGDSEAELEIEEGFDLERPLSAP